MKIKLKPLGVLKKFVQEGEIEIDPSTTCGVLIEGLKIPEFFKTVAFINGKSVDLDAKIAEPCEVTLVTLVRGG